MAEQLERLPVYCYMENLWTNPHIAPDGTPYYPAAPVQMTYSLEETERLMEHLKNNFKNFPKTS